jgi:hypothetical protein
MPADLVLRAMTARAELETSYNRLIVAAIAQPAENVGIE